MSYDYSSGRSVSGRCCYVQADYFTSTKFRHTKSVTQLVRFRLTWKFGGGKKVDAEQKSIGNDVGRFRE